MEMNIADVLFLGNYTRIKSAALEVETSSSQYLVPTKMKYHT